MPNVGDQSTELLELVLFDEPRYGIIDGSTCPMRCCKCRLPGGQWREPLDMLVPLLSRRVRCCGVGELESPEVQG